MDKKNNGMNCVAFLTFFNESLSINDRNLIDNHLFDNEKYMTENE